MHDHDKILRGATKMRSQCTQHLKTHQMFYSTKTVVIQYVENTSQQMLKVYLLHLYLKSCVVWLARLKCTALNDLLFKLWIITMTRLDEGH